MRRIPGHLLLSLLVVIGAAERLSAGDVPSDAAVLDVYAPADARLLINGEDMKENRRLQFSGFAEGASFDYEVRVIFAEGREFKRTIPLSRGSEQILSYTAMLVDPQGPLSGEQVKDLLAQLRQLRGEVNSLLQAKNEEGVLEKAPALVDVDRQLLAYMELYADKSAERDSAMRACRQELNYLLGKLGGTFVVQGEFAKAKPFFEELASVRRSLYGPEAKEVVEIQTALANLRSRLSRPVATEPTAKPSSTENEARLAEAEQLDRQGVALHGQGKASEAIALATRSLAIRKEILGDDHPATALSLFNLGFLLKDSGDPKAARPYFEKALAIRKKTLGEKHPDSIENLIHLGLLLKDLKDFTPARLRLERALALQKEVFGERSLNAAASMNHLGLLLREMGDNGAARAYYGQALAILKEVSGEKSADTATALNNLGLLLQAMGDYAAARSYYEQALAIRKEISGDKSVETAASLSELGHLLTEASDFAAARPCLEQALAIQRELLGEKNATTASTLNKLGYLLAEMGNYAAARSYYEHALAIRREVLGERSPETAESLNNLGTVLQAMGDNSAALPYYRLALSIHKEVLGEKSRATAGSLNNVGNLLVLQGDYAAARPYLEQALAIHRELLGNENATTARSLNNLGGVLMKMDDLAAARPYFEEALAIWKETQGANHPDTAMSLDNLGGLLACMNDWQGASAMVDESRRVVRRHVARVLPGMSEKEQLTFLEANDRWSLYAALSYGLARSESPEISQLSAAWLLNGKAVAQEAIAQRTLLARLATDPATAGLVQQLGAVRERLAHFAVAIPDPGKLEEHRQQIAALEQQEAEIVRRLGQARIDAKLPDPWIELADIQRNLPADSVLIDIARFQPVTFNSQGNFQPARYVAWVIPPGDKAVKVVDLGDAEAIDTTVEEFQAAISNEQVGKALQTVGEAKAEAILREKLTVIAEKALRPLEPIIGDTPQWIISADGALWLVPWAALPTKDGRYALENHLISYLISGRELTESARPHQTGPALVLANPDYSAATGSRGDDPADVGVRGYSRELASIAWEPLPGTAREAEMILPKLSQYLGQTPIVVTQGEATEGKVKESKNPRLAVLMTHGFYLPTQEIGSAPHEQALRGIVRVGDRKGREIENPLLRCGLVFAGANRHQRADSSGDDGMLLGLEIVGADFRGTELVVLSACETGLGEVKSGEGVAGLRQAFQLSGAEGVLATLWQIPDVQTAQLMSRFWEDLAAKKSSPEALREAQLAVIRERRAKAGAAHPIFWAAFTYTGRSHATGPLNAEPPKSTRVEVTASNSKLYDGSTVIAEAIKGQSFPFDPARDDKSYYLITIVENGKERQAWLLKTDARVVDVAAAKEESPAGPAVAERQTPLVSDESAVDLDSAVVSLAQAIAKYLKDNSQSEASLGAFLCATPQLQATGGPGIVLKLAAALEKQGIAVKRRAAYGIKGEFRYEGGMRGIKRAGRSSANSGIVLEAQVVDRSGKVALSLRRRFVDAPSVATLLGATADLSKPKAPMEREQAFEQAIAEPSVAITNSEIRSRSASPYTVEVLTRGPEGYYPLPARIEDGMAFVAILPDALYAVRVTNHSNHDAAVTLTIDGLNMFSFSDNKEYSYFILAKEQSAEITGWHRSNERSDAFQITDYGKSAAAELLANPSALGTITVAIAAAWPEGAPVPPDEPAPELASRGRATGRGPEISAQYVERRRHVGVLRDVISVRYDK